MRMVGALSSVVRETALEMGVEYECTKVWRPSDPNAIEYTLSNKELAMCVYGRMGIMCARAGVPEMKMTKPQGSWFYDGFTTRISI